MFLVPYLLLPFTWLLSPRSANMAAAVHEVPQRSWRDARLLPDRPSVDVPYGWPGASGLEFKCPHNCTLMLCCRTTLASARAPVKWVTQR